MKETEQPKAGSLAASLPLASCDPPSPPPYTRQNKQDMQKQNGEKRKDEEGDPCLFSTPRGWLYICVWKYVNTSCLHAHAAT